MPTHNALSKANPIEPQEMNGNATDEKRERGGSLNRDQHQAGFSHDIVARIQQGHTTPPTSSSESTTVYNKSIMNLSCVTPHNKCPTPLQPGVDPLNELSKQHTPTKTNPSACHK